MKNGQLFQQFPWSDTPNVGRPGICSAREEDELDPSYGGGHSNDDLNEEEREERAERLRFASHEEAERGYRELQSSYTKDHERLLMTDRRLNSLEEELRGLRSQQTGSQQSEEIPPWRKKGEVIAEDLIKELEKLGPRDGNPDYTKRYLAALAGRIYQEFETDKSQLPQMVKETMSVEEQEARGREIANSHALKELKDYGFDERHFKMLVSMRDQIRAEDPTWFDRTPLERQIPDLVKNYADLYGRTKQTDSSDSNDAGQNFDQQPGPSNGSRFSKEDIRAEQRRRVSGSIHGGAKVNMSNFKDATLNPNTNRNAKEKTPGSFLEDLKNLRMERRNQARQRSR